VPWARRGDYGERVTDVQVPPATAVARGQRRLLAELAAGAAASAAVGAVLWVRGRRAGRSGVVGFGRQTVAWAVVDAAIVGWGVRGLARSPQDDDGAGRTARRMRLLTAANAGADVGYVALGAALARRPDRRGDGLAVVVQGLFLLWLDARHARRFHRLARRTA